MENKDIRHKSSQRVHKSRREDIREFCKEEIQRQVEDEVANKVIVTIGNSELDEDHWHFVVASWCLRVGALYGFAQLILNVYSLISSFFTSNVVWR